jgi:serine phosphatase RsbU (regulator of sigma subunit)
LNRGGPPAGLLPDAEFEQELLQLYVGDACLLVTDGVTEAQDGDTLLARDLEASRECHSAPSAADICQTVMARALSGHGPLAAQEWDDDRTVVVVKVCESLAADPDMVAVSAATV